MLRRAILRVVLVAFFPRAGALQESQTIVIKLERTTCFGECPVYSVVINGDGTVLFEGEKFVRVQGRATDRIPTPRVAAILETVERIHFFDLDDRYREIHNADGTTTIVTDLPTTFVTLTIGQRTKRVEDYVGAPTGLKELERRIDEAARTKRWISLDAVTLSQLVADGWTPSSDERADLLRKALNADDVAVAKGLIDLGADPNGSYFGTHTPPLMFAQSGAAVELLVGAGAIPFARNDNGFTVLHSSTYKSPDVAVALIKAGVRPDEAADRSGVTALWYAACAGNAGVVAVLLKAGANPAAQSPQSVTARECAVRGREDESRSRALPLGTPRYRKDFDQTIALLDSALANRRRQ